MSNQTSILEENSIKSLRIPQQILKHYEKLRILKEKEEDWLAKSEEQLWTELCFCILSANVSYELAKSCIEILNYLGLMNSRWLINNEKSANTLFSVLNSPIFRPNKKDGSLRKYRYPKKRAQQIKSAAIFIYSENKSIKNILQKFDSDVNVRNFFADNIPGLGIKEASHFLRNIGYSNSLAILDVHMIEFLRQSSIIKLKRGRSLTHSIYLKIEEILRKLAYFHKLNLAIFDLAVWYYMRSLR